MSKKKLIVSFKKLSQELLDAVLEAYPDGFDASIKMYPKNASEVFYAFPFETEDTSYLIKVDVIIDEDSEDGDVDMTFDTDIPSTGKEVLKGEFDEDDDTADEDSAFDDNFDDDDDEGDDDEE